MSTKKLKWVLQELEGFESPKIQLEQYATSPELALSMMDLIDELVGFDNKVVADLGCGCGMLMTTAALAHGPGFVVGVDIDSDALETCARNLEDADIEEFCDLVHADVLTVSETLGSKFDIVLINPPFGTKNNEGIDMKFVKSGLDILKPGGSVFSLHKQSTRNFILKTAKNWNVEAKCVAELTWNLPATYKFHKQQNVDIKVDLIQFIKL